MAHDEGHAERMRELIAGVGRIEEKRMFGGLCFMLDGHMLCGVHKDGGMARVGKAREAEALAIEGVASMAFTGRRMGGLVDLDEGLIGDDARLRAVIGLAIANVRSLPPR